MRVFDFLGYLIELREATTVAAVDRISRRMERRIAANLAHPTRAAMVRERAAARRAVLGASTELRLRP
jgi:hypothetical protein